MGPELEFYLLERSEAPRRLGALRREPDARLHGRRPRRSARRARPHAAEPYDAELGVIGAAHEYGMSQWEINLDHSAALDAADRAFRFKAAVKDLATREGMLATFMGKPFNGDAGSGFHLHLSLCGEDGANAFDEPAGDEGCAELLRHFIAGVIAHAPGLMAFLNPTVNSYRRIDPHELVPTRACWGYDNRFGLVRVPPERGAATRVEMRLADGSANVYLATAALLFAGLDGVQRKLDASGAVHGLVYELPEEEQGDPIPLSLDAALDALEADTTLREAMGRARRDVPHHQALRAGALPPPRLRVGPGGVRAPPLASCASYPCRGQQRARATSASVEKPSACAASVADCTSWCRPTRPRSARSRVAVPSVRKKTSRPRSTACRAVVSQHMCVMNPPITSTARRRVGSAPRPARCS